MSFDLQDGNVSGTTLASDLTTEQKVSVLISTLSDYREFIRHLETRGHTITATMCSVLVVLPVFGMKPLPPETQTLLVIQMIFLTVVAGLGIWILWLNRSHLQFLRRATIRVLQVLGAFDDGVYVRKRFSEVQSHQLWFQGLSLLPAKDQRWGADNWLETHLPFLASVVVAWLCSLAITARTGGIL